MKEQCELEEELGLKVSLQILLKHNSPHSAAGPSSSIAHRWFVFISIFCVSYLFVDSTTYSKQKLQSNKRRFTYPVAIRSGGVNQKRPAV